MELSDDILVLKNLVISLLAKVEELTKENAILKAENIELRQRLGINSGNSSLPPSKDLYKIKPALTKLSKGKQGGQVGHTGKTLLKIQNPDKVVVLLPNVCSCGYNLKSTPSTLKQSRQVFDLPQPKLEVTEYQQYACVCPNCSQEVKGSFPSEVTNGVQYGSGVMALCSLLSSSFHLSCQQISQLFTDLFDQPLNGATVITANARTYKALENSENIIREQLLAARTTHFDETGIACEKNNYWLHTACNNLFTYLFVHSKRGLEALKSEQSLLADFTNWAIHDCWVSYFSFEKMQHALCNAHLLRELQALIENNSQWATKMHQLLLNLYYLSDNGKGVVVDLSPHLILYQQICQEANLEEPPPIKSKRGRSKSSKGRNLLNRLLEHQDSVLAFAKYEHIPFTNNLAERSIRPVKSKIKIAGCFRSKAGADHFARIQGFVATARKHSHSVFKELKNAYQGFTFIESTYQAAK